MKKTIFLFAALIFILSTEIDARHYRNGVTFNYFYSTLSPYGEWIELDYNVFAWRPLMVDHQWQPYSFGRWSWTRYGWYWESYEPFGWATYHYGRWYFDDYYGWLWIPGYEWGPSWVEWRYSNSYIGWAPLPPYASFRFSVGIHFSINWFAPINHWRFVRYNHFCNPYVSNYYIAGGNVRGIFHNTKYRTNYYQNNGRLINGGVPRDYIQRKSGVRIVERQMVQARGRNDYSNSRTVSKNVVKYYQPSDSDVRNQRAPGKIVVRKNDHSRSINTDKFADGLRRTTRGSSLSKENKNEKSVSQRARKKVDRKVTNDPGRSRESSKGFAAGKKNTRSKESSIRKKNEKNYSTIKKRIQQKNRQNMNSRSSNKTGKNINKRQYSNKNSVNSGKTGNRNRKSARSNNQKRKNSSSRKSKRAPEKSKSRNR